MQERVDFLTKLITRQTKKQTHVCAGIDPVLSKMPLDGTEVMGKGPIHRRLLAFTKSYVDATAEYVCIYKPNQAFWAAHGAENELVELIRYIHTKYDIQVILDCKRGDIGATAEFYAMEAFERYDADAATVNPYLGLDTLDPWLEYGPEKAIFVLCHTSNPGAKDFQERILQGAKPYGLELWEEVASRLAFDKANSNGTQIGLVMGATYPDQIGRLTELVGLSQMPLLIPGIGKQGGDLKAVLEKAFDFPFVINSSSGLMHASKDIDTWEEASADASRVLRNEINETLESIVSSVK